MSGANLTVGAWLARMREALTLNEAGASDPTHEGNEALGDVLRWLADNAPPGMHVPAGLDPRRGRSAVVSVRMPAKIRDAFKAAAATSGRSLSGEVLHRAASTLEADGA